MLQPQSHMTLFLRAQFSSKEGEKEYITRLSISRDATSRWTVSVERGGQEPMEMSGEGNLPAILEAGGAIIIVFPQSADPFPPSPPTFSAGVDAPDSI